MSKKRLVELLKHKYDHFCDQCGINKQSDYIENLADYLLVNGVIVPPCKVGDKVWFIERGICFGDKRISEGFVARFDIREMPELGLTHNVVIIPLDAIDNRMRFSLFEFFGDEYYTSREEAEKKLKE